MMSSVRTLSLESNRLEEIYETIKYLKQKFPGVQNLNLIGNPLNPKAKNEEYTAFRNRIRDNLEQVTTLDGIVIEKRLEENDPVAMMLKAAQKRPVVEEKKNPADEIKVDSTKKTVIAVKKKPVLKTTIDNLSDRILKSHSEGNRFITNDDL